MLKALVKNWKTTAFGLITGLPLIVQGVKTQDWNLVIAGLGAIVGGSASKDFDVNGN